MRPDSTIYRFLRSGSADDALSCHIQREQPPTRALFPVAYRLDLANHSPDGFEWGYAGSGPAQSALAILADFTEDDDLALKLHQAFKTAHIEPMDHEGGTITGEQIRQWLETFGEVEERTMTIAELVIELAELEGPEKAVVARSPAGNYSIRIYVHERLE